MNQSINCPACTELLIAIKHDSHYFLSGPSATHVMSHDNQTKAKISIPIALALERMK